MKSTLKEKRGEMESYICERCSAETDESLYCEECAQDGLCAECFAGHDCDEEGQ